ncbi:MAG TPA: hypothetical protein EYO24_04370, partial [Candidatus Marinimicrobia bacterium]|nr:hypothetical protein [Candidatus Neomarinimicrobiota bacterium]
TAVEDLEDEIDEAFLEEEGFDEEPEISESWFKLPGGLSLRSAGVNLGFYKPSMAYWNDSYGSSAQHPNTPWTVSSSFGMSFLVQAGMRLNLNAENTLWTELGAGFWSGSAELKGTYADLGGANGTEKIEYSIMPINISVGYSLSDLLPFDGIYAGAGLGANKITMTQTTDSDTPKESSGFGTMYHLLVGYDYPLTDQLSLGAELQIALGGHKHALASQTTEDISLSGPKILLQVNYLFSSDND